MAARLELLKEQFFDDNGDVLNGGLLYTYIVNTTTAKTTYTTALGDVEQANPVVLDSDGRIPSDLYGVGAYKIVITDSAGTTIDTIPTVSGINSASMTTIGDYSGDFDAAITAISTTETTLYVDETATMSATVTVPATCAVIVQKGGLIDMAGNALTFNGPLYMNGGTITHDAALTINKDFRAGPYDVGFDSTQTITFGENAVTEFYPQWWGENTTPGTTDMTTNIQAASTAAGTTGKVFIPNGTYKVTDAGGVPITYDPRVVFEGESREGVIIQNSSTTAYTFQYHSTVGDAYTAFDNPGGFKNMEIYAKFGIKFNQSLAEIGGIYTGDWNEQDITLGWNIYNISFKGDSTSAADSDADSDTEPSGISDYTTYGVGLYMVRPYHTEVHQCAFRHHGVGIFMEGCDATLIDQNRFIYNSIHIYGTNGTDSTWGHNTKVSHNDFLEFYRRRAIWLDGQASKFGGWTICDNFFEESGAEAEYIYVDAGYMHKIHSNFFSGTNHATTPMLNFVNDGYGHLIHSNTYGVPTTTDPIINVDWMTTASDLTKRWIYFYGNSLEMPKPNYPRGIQRSPEDIQPFTFDCVENCDKWEAGDAHNDDAPFVDFDGFPHLDTSQGSVDIYFRDDRVDRLTSFNLHIKGIITGGATGAQSVSIVVYHDTTADYNSTFLTNVTDDDLVDVIIPIISGAGYKRVYFYENLYLAISSIEIEPATPRYIIPTFTDEDETPSVNGMTRALTNTTGVTITRFDDGVEGQELTIISKGAIVFDTSSASRLIGSSADITTASGDVTFWICETGGTTSSVWRLKGFVDISADNSTGA